MGFIDLFPTVIFHKILEDITSNDFKQYENQILEDNYIPSYSGHTSTNQQFLLNPLFNNLTTQILYNSKLYLNEVGHDYKDIQITSSWANILNKNEYINPHAHSNSYLSGVFYIEDSSDIYFENNTIMKSSFTPDFVKAKKHEYRKKTSFKITPKKGSLIIFPSWLIHSVPSNNLDKRLSIAFNIIPKGEFGSITTKMYI